MFLRSSRASNGVSRERPVIPCVLAKVFGLVGLEEGK